MDLSVFYWPLHFHPKRMETSLYKVYQGIIYSDILDSNNHLSGMGTSRKPSVCRASSIRTRAMYGCSRYSSLATMTTAPSASGGIFLMMPSLRCCWWPRVADEGLRLMAEEDWSWDLWCSGFSWLIIDNLASWMSVCCGKDNNITKQSLHFFRTNYTIHE